MDYVVQIKKNQNLQVRNISYIVKEPKVNTHRGIARINNPNNNNNRCHQNKDNKEKNTKNAPQGNENSFHKLYPVI